MEKELRTRLNLFRVGFSVSLDRNDSCMGDSRRIPCVVFLFSEESG